MIKKILLSLAAIIAIVLVVAAFQPSEFRVTRSATIAAPAAVIFPEINDFHRWAAWSPWEKLDPAMQRTFAGAAAGEGAVYAWEGNSDVGSGRMTITGSRPAEAITIRLEFFTPMPGVCPTEFTFRPEGGSTRVTWTMSGTNNYLSKVVCLFMNMDKMIGGDFEKGLAELKRLAEAKK
ncbi:MAG TPA: SRPBCC family protein [Lacunisphaera sp.]